METSLKFLELLHEFDVDHLEAHPAAVYGIWPDYTLGFANSAWNQFFSQNGGQSTRRIVIGSSILESIPPILQKFYRDHFDAVLHEGRPWEHVYECSGPDEMRQFHMLTYPLAHRQGLIIINSLRYEEPRNAPAAQAHASYADERGMVLQCSHCRRVRTPHAVETWDWAPSLVRERLPKVSHGLCPPCYAFYYGEQGARESLPKSMSTIDAPSPEAARLLEQFRPVKGREGKHSPKPVLTSPEEAFYSAKSARRVN